MYLFTHFTSEQENGEQIYFSVSEDGLHFNDLNDGKPVLVSTLGEAGIRDPFIIKNPVTNIYYIIGTDLRIGAGKGWHVAQHEGSRDLIVFESKDLVNWSAPRLISVGVESAGCCWAPEAIWDVEKEQFFVFWASMVQMDGDKAPKQRMYAMYTVDFKTWTEPFLYYEAQNHTIDMNIVYEHGWYYRFMKDETTKRIIMDRVKTLTNVLSEPIHSEVLANFEGVEGPQTYQLPDGDWCLIVDQFGSGKGYIPLVCKDLSKGDFRILNSDEYHMGTLKKRHGGVIKISEGEYHTLINLL